MEIRLSACLMESGNIITLHVEYNTARGVAPGVGCEHWIVWRPGAAHHGWAAPGEILEFEAPKRDSVT